MKEYIFGYQTRLRYYKFYKIDTGLKVVIVQRMSSKRYLPPKEVIIRTSEKDVDKLINNIRDGVYAY